MSAFIFAGPTLSADEIVAGMPGAHVLPPVSQGDVYRVALLRPTAIGIIDGYFHRIPAVWHKEILWAMTQGIHVFGAASMGALRAAELEAFGMVGVGEVFEAFRGGVLEDDDEVAVMHASAEHGYRTASEAMVNIRATLRKAAGCGILDEASRASLEKTGKELFYGERSYERILEGCDWPPEEIAEFRGWLQSEKLDVKRNDAIAMVRHMRSFLDGSPSPKRVEWIFENTTFFEKLKRTSAEEPSEAFPDLEAGVLEEARRSPEIFTRALEASVALALSESVLAAEAGEDIGREMNAVVLEFQSRHGLSDPEALLNWYVKNHCDPENLQLLLYRRSALQWAASNIGAKLGLYTLDYLRWTGEFARLRQRSAPACEPET